jgi:ketosteroid isomerase-like protein
MILFNISKANNAIPNTITDDSISNEILLRNRQMEAAFAANDMMRVASFYSDSCVLIGENVLIKGRKNTDAYWLSLKDRGVSWNLEIIKIDACDNLAVQQVISKLVYSVQGQEILSVVRFTLVWKRVNGEWLIEVDHYSAI